MVHYRTEAIGKGMMINAPANGTHGSYPMVASPHDLLDAAPPSDTASELCYCHCIMVDGAQLAETMSMVDPKDFYDLRCRFFVEYVRDQHRAGVPTFDRNFNVAGLKGAGFERVTGMTIGDFLADVTATGAPAPMAKYYAGFIKRRAFARFMRAAGEEIIRYSGNTSEADRDFQGFRLAPGAIIESKLGGTQVAGWQLDMLTSAEFDAGDFRVEYLIDGIMPARQPMAVGAPMKTMKTTVGGVALGVSLALGIPFLGRFEVPRRVRTLLVSGESGRGTLQDTGRRIVNEAGYSLAECDYLFWSTNPPRLDNPLHLQTLRKQMGDAGIEVLILDPLYLMIPGQDASNAMIMGALLQGVGSICDELGITLLLIHHTKRNLTAPHAPGQLSDLMWAGIAEYVRSWLLLTRRKPYKPGTGDHELWMVAGGSAGHSGLWGLDIHEGVGSDRTWAVSLRNEDEIKAASDDRQTQAKQDEKHTQWEADAKQIISVLVKCPDGETKTTVRDRLGLSGPRFNGALAFLLDSDDPQVECCQIIKGNNRHYPGIRLPRGGASA